MTKLSREQIEKQLLSKPGAWIDYPFGEEVAVYKVKDKMFALIAEGKTPVRLSLKCDPLLAQDLRERFEEVLPGYHLNKRHWNTIIVSGQLEDDKIRDLINHSYDLVSKKLSPEEREELGL